MNPFHFPPGCMVAGGMKGGAAWSRPPASAAVFTPNTPSGLIATIDPGVARTNGLIWQDVGKTTLATADGHTVRAIDCPYTGAHWTTPGSAFTLKNVGGSWFLRSAANARFLLTQSIDLSVSASFVQVNISSSRGDNHFCSSTVTGGNYYGILDVTDSVGPAPSPHDAFTTFGSTDGVHYTSQKCAVNTPYVACNVLNGSSSFMEVNGVWCFDGYSNAGATVAGWTVAGILGFDQYSVIGDIGFHALYTTIPSLTNRGNLHRYIMDATGKTVPTKLLATIGNSLTRGDWSADGTSYPLVANASLGSAWTSYQYGISGIQTSALVTASPALIVTAATSPLSFTTKIATIWEGVNHLNGGAATAAAAYASLVSLCNLWKAAGYTVILIDVAPANPGSPSSGFLTRRTALNTLLKADFTASTGQSLIFGPAGGVTHADYFYQVSAEAVLQNTADTNYYVADEVHGIAAYHAVVAAGIVRAVGLVP